MKITAHIDLQGNPAVFLFTWYRISNDCLV